MPKNVKGITIEIGANAQGFQKELAKINKESKQTANKLKDINKLLKLDPKNTQLLEQKQRTLNTAIDQTQKRLNLTRDELKKLKEENPDQVTEKMDALERQIAEDEAKLKSLNKELKKFGDVGKQQAVAVGQKLQETGKKIEEVGGKIKGVGDSMTKNVTAPIVAVGTASLAAFNEVDSAYDTVIQKTGATGEAAKELQGIVDNLATSIPTDFGTAADAVGEVNTRFGLTGEALQELSEKFIMFAQLNNTDVTSSVDSVQKALSAYGLTADDAGALLDRLNKTGQETGVSVDTLTSGLIQNGTAFQELGLNIDQSVALMGEMEKSGANSETVMQGLRKALKNAAEEGVPLDKALSDLQDTIENGKDGMDGLTAAYDLFGKSGDQIYGAVKNGSLDFRNLGEEASDAAGSVAETFTETLDPIDEWKITRNQLKLTGAELGATLGEILQPILEKVSEVVQTLREKWEGLTPEQQKMIEQVALLVATVGPVVSIIGSIVTGIGGLITAIGTIAATLGVSIGLMGGVVLGITAIIAIIVLVITHWDSLKAKVQEVWTAISQYMSQLKDSISSKWEEIKSNISQKITAIKTDLSNKWNQIKSDAVSKVTGMKNDVVNKIGELKSSAVEKLNDIKSQFTQKFNDIKDKVKSVIEDIKGFFSGLKLKLPSIELPPLPHFSISGEFSLNPPSVPHLSVDWYAKAMETPYMFTTPTVVGAGEAGHEIMYGQQALLRDIATATASNNAALVDGMYVAFTAALKSANLTVQISNREFGRILREAGAL